MSGLNQPLNQNNNADSDSIDKQKNEVSIKSQKTYFAPSQSNKIQENEFQEKEFEQPQKGFVYFFSTGLIFQFIGSIIICSDIFISFLNVNSSTDKIFYFKVVFVIVSTVAYSTYAYICYEANQCQPLSITKSIRVSFLFTIITFLIGLYIFTETKVQEWVCSYSLTGKDCYATKVYPKNYETRTQCCGIPLVLLIIGLIKYILLCRERQRKLKENEVSQNSSSKTPKTVEMNSNLIGGQSNDLTPLGEEFKVIGDDSNFFSNKQKFIYNADADTSKYAYSSKAMFNPSQSIDFKNKNIQETVPNGDPDRQNNPQYNLNNDQL